MRASERESEDERERESERARDRSLVELPRRATHSQVFPQNSRLRIKSLFWSKLRSLKKAIWSDCEGRALVGRAHWIKQLPNVEDSVPFRGVSRPPYKGSRLPCKGVRVVSIGTVAVLDANVRISYLQKNEGLRLRV